MNKIEHLIAMMEKPDHYSQKEWRQVLSDKDCTLREAIHVR